MRAHETRDRPGPLLQGQRRLRYSSATMYLPPHFKSKDRAQAVDLMRAYPLCTLISNDNDGFPFVSHLPLHLEQRGEQLVLLGHCAKPNAHWR